MVLLLSLSAGCAAPARPDEPAPLSGAKPVSADGQPVPDASCEDRIGSAMQTNQALRTSVAGIADPAVRDHAAQLLDEALQPLTDACRRNSVLWENEAMLRAAGLHGDVRSLLGAGKRPVQ